MIDGVVNYLLKKNIFKEGMIVYWAEVLGSSGYEIAVDDGNTRTIVEISASERKYTVYENQLGVSYFVRAVNKNHNEYGNWYPIIFDFESSVESSKEVINPEIIGVAKNAEKGVRIYWIGDDGTIGWRVYCNDDIVGEFMNVCTWEWVDTKHSISDDVAYRIVAVDKDADGNIIEVASSNTYCTKSMINKKIAVKKQIPEGIVVSWSNIINKKSLVKLFRKENERGKYKLIYSGDSNKNVFVDNVGSDTARYILQFEKGKQPFNTKPLKLMVEKHIDKPTGLTCIATAKSAQIIWDSQKDVDFWNIRRCTKEIPAGELIITTDFSESWWVDRDYSETTIGYKVEGVKKGDQYNTLSGYCKMAAVNFQECGQ